jgi:hypothetical protein
MDIYSGKRESVIQCLVEALRMISTHDCPALAEKYCVDATGILLDMQRIQSELPEAVNQ